MMRDEALDMLDPDPLLYLLSEAGGGFGAAALDQAFFAAVIEMRTMGRVNPKDPQARAPTRTDAAVTSGVVDLFFEEFEAALATVRDCAWARGYRQVDHLDRRKTAQLLLDDSEFRVVDIRLDLAAGTRQGRLTLMYPAERSRPGGKVQKLAEAATEWHSRMNETVSETPVPLKAVLWRLRMPISRVEGLSVGDVLQVPMMSVGQVSLEGLDGSKVVSGHLGQSEGKKAVRILLSPEEGGALVQGLAALTGAPPEAPETTPDLPDIGGLPDLPTGDLPDLGGEGNLPELGDLPMASPMDLDIE